MNRKTKSGIILTSLAAIAFAGSLLAGSTYALFTSESKNSIVVQSGKVDVEATISDLSLYSPVSINMDENNTVNGDGNGANNESKTFKNGGSATLDGGKLTLSGVTPGDKVTFNIKITNHSTVSTKYRTVVSCEEDDGLFFGLKCTIGNNDTFNGLTKKYAWADLAAQTSPSAIPCTVELPTTAGNAYQGKGCTITFTIEAVQGNTATTDQAEGTYELYNANDLKWFQKNASTIKGKTVNLMNDINLNGIDWAPINWWCADNNTGNVVGTFNGNKHTISNFKVTKNQEYYDNLAADKKEQNGFYKNLGLFGQVASVVIKDLTIESARVSGIGRVGAVVGHGTGGITITNCKAIKCNITAKVYESEDGDKAGGIAGILNDGTSTLESCTVDNCEITAFRDLGGLAGRVADVKTNGKVTSNTVKNTKVYYYSSSYGYNDHLNEYEKVDILVGNTENQNFSGNTTAENNLITKKD